MDFSGKKILILGANPETVSLILKAKAMGIVTYVTDYDPIAYAKRYADVSLNIDATDVDKLTGFCQEEGIDAVLVGVAESLLPSYYMLCKNLSLPCFATMEQFEIMISKDKFKKVCRKFEVPVVQEFQVDKLDSIQYPVVVKPVDSCSSKGISVCKDIGELEIGIHKALQFSNTKSFLLEKYMTGEEVVIYYVIQNGVPSLVGMCDRYTNKEQLGSAQLPTSYIFPSRHLLRYMHETDATICSMLKGLNLENGVLFLQAFIENGLVRIYEPGFRLNGAQEHLILSETTGVDAKELLIHFAFTGIMGDKVISEVADPTLHGKWACKLSPLVRVGRINKLIGIDKIKSFPDVISINPSYNEGDIVVGQGTLKQIICRFFIVSATREQLKKTIDNIYREFNVLDHQGNSMLLSCFDTDIIINQYE